MPLKTGIPVLQGGEDVNVSDYYTRIVVLLAVAFVAGWGWGQWWAERAIRAERAAQDSGRVSVSMPMRPDDAAATMRLLSDLIEQVEREKDGAAHAANDQVQP